MPEQETSNEPRGAGNRLAMITALAVGLPLLYALSLGPVVSVMEKTRGFDGKVSWHTVETFYRPILWLHEHTFLKHPIDIYLELCGVK